MNISETQAYEIVVEIIKPFARNPEAVNSISMETRIMEDLRVNSARLIDIVITFEKKFDIEIDDQAVDSLRTIGDVVRLIQTRALAHGGK